MFRRDGADGGSFKAKLIAKEELLNQLKFELRKKVGCLITTVMFSSMLLNLF